MNIIKVLNKQKEAGKNIILENGDIIAVDQMEKAALKNYLAGIKDGSIDPATSLKEYTEEKSKNNLSIDEVIDYISNVTDVVEGEEIDEDDEE